jgi:glutaminyl-peptide cyclotransferase
LRRVRLRAALLLLLAACALAACGNGSDAGPGTATAAAAKRADRFDVEAAWRLTKLQVRAGQRPAGSPQLRRLAVRLRDALPGGRFEAIPGEPRLRNVVATLPGTKPALVIGAHYDTLVEPKGFVGANNGASGSAIVVQAARELARSRPKGGPELRFVLFDGEEPAAGLPEEQPDFYSVGLRGSRAYVQQHAADVGHMVLLDYVAGKGLQLPREATSDEALWDRVRTAARDAGAGRFFPDGTGPAITDDHTPFLRAGIPAVDLIDWSYPGHSLRDGLDRLSKPAMDGVGETVVQLVRSWDTGA